MPSRMLHFIIGQGLCSEFSNIDENQFQIGNLVPDIGNKSIKEKEKSHFIYTDSEDRKIRYDVYFNKYIDHREINSFYLGYYCHLMVDWHWIEKIFRPLTKCSDFSLVKYYNDLAILNGLAASYIDKHIELEYNFEFSLEEVCLTTDSVLEVINSFKRDLVCDNSSLSSLNLLKLKEIKRFIVEETKILSKHIGGFI